LHIAKIGYISFDYCDICKEEITLGNCYDEASNGNHPSIHGDLFLRQRPEYGGGEICFDDVLVSNDGRFVVKELEILNPEAYT
jgi:Leucyl aminopeptidase (aminopeptidase T)